MKLKIKQIFRFVIIPLGILLAVAAGVGNFFFKLALKSNTKKDRVLKAPHNCANNEQRQKQKNEDKQKVDRWFAQIASAEQYITSNDGLKLHGLHLLNNSESNRMVIICHGYYGNSRQMLPQAKVFYEMDFHVLIPDFRGHGESQGDYIGMGWHDRLDLLRWIQWGGDQNADMEIVLYGISMGAATVMMAAGENLPANVKVIIEDCGYSSIWDEFSYQLKQLYHLPAFPVMYMASLMTKIRSGFWLWEGNAKKQVSKSKTPILFIHGDEDTFVPSAMLEKVYQAANGPKDKLVVKGAGHGEASNIEKEIYWDKVISFIFQYIGQKTEKG